MRANICALPGISPPDTKTKPEYEAGAATMGVWVGVGVTVGVGMGRFGKLRLKLETTTGSEYAINLAVSSACTVSIWNVTTWPAKDTFGGPIVKPTYRPFVTVTDGEI